MRKLLLLSALLMAFAAPTEAKKQKKLTEKDMGAYLFTYFNDPTHSLFMAISYDGYTFTAINGSDPIIAGDSIADQRGIRDPHIYRAPNGKFYIAMRKDCAPHSGSALTNMAGATIEVWCSWLPKT